MVMQELTLSSPLGGHQRLQCVNGIQEPIWLPLLARSKHSSAASTMHLFSLPQLSSGWSSTQCGCCRRSWHRVCWNSSLQSLLLRECTARGTRVSSFFFLGICSWTFPLSKWWSDYNSKHFCRPSRLDTVTSAPSSSAHSQSCVPAWWQGASRLPDAPVASQTRCS